MRFNNRNPNLKTMKKAYKYIFFTFFYSFTFSLLAQPANNLCEDAIEFTDLENGCITVDNTGATNDNYSAGCLDYSNTIWFKFTSQGYNATINVSGDADINRPQFAVFEIEFGEDGCDLNNVNGVFCFDGPGGNWDELEGIAMTEPGIEYYVQVVTNTGGGGDPGDVTVCIDNPEPEIGRGCDVDVTICEGNTAGPFDFRPSSTGGPAADTDFARGSCLTGVAGLTHDYAWVLLNIAEEGDLNILLDGDDDTGFLDLIVFNVPQGMDPCVAVQDPDNEIACNYAIASSGCVELGDEFDCTASAEAPTVEAGDQIMIIVHDYSNSHEEFTISIGDPPSAQTGYLDASIDPAGPFCIDDEDVFLSAAVGGGLWTGNGIVNSSSGVFSPNEAGVGTHIITYTLTGDCGDEQTTSITVVDDCLLLPVELIFFDVRAEEDKNVILWTTKSEINNDYFIVEFSTNGVDWRKIEKVNGAGNTSKKQTYSLSHDNFPSEINYYRLTQYDFDGDNETFHIISIDNRTNVKLIKTINSIGQEVDENYKGIVIEYYDDGSTIKRYQNK